MFTGHTWRRTSAQSMANAGCVSSAQMRTFYRWENDKTANEYLHNSTHGHLQCADALAKHVVVSKETHKSADIPPLNINNNTNCTINIQLN